MESDAIHLLNPGSYPGVKGSPIKLGNTQESYLFIQPNASDSFPDARVPSPDIPRPLVVVAAVPDLGREFKPCGALETRQDHEAADEDPPCPPVRRDVLEAEGR